MAWRLPKRWLALSVLIGLMAGVGGYTFSYAGGLKYMSKDPEVCAQCHIMNDQYDSWRKGPHHAAATCYDCHLPPHFPQNYIAKGVNGYNHSMGFTFQPPRPDDPGEKMYFHEPIQIKPMNSQILQDNCLRCHGDFVHDIVAGSTTGENAVRCVHCHRGVGHGAMK